MYSAVEDAWKAKAMMMMMAAEKTSRPAKSALWRSVRGSGWLRAVMDPPPPFFRRHSAEFCRFMNSGALCLAELL
jgi:hypothetical protein